MTELPQLIANLLDPARFPDPAGEVELIQTHISWVLLAGGYAYKIKKPVDLGFLDFSSLERRRFFCHEELRLNRRLAADYYLDVLPIGGSPAAPRIGSEPAIEYALKMRRFPQAAQFDRLLAAGRLLPGQLDDLARRIADFHAAAAAAPAGSRFGGLALIAAEARENFASLRQALDAPAAMAGVEALAGWTESQLTRLAGVIEARRRAGRVRECHGDLHLRNLAWVDGRALAFDCIEFSEELRWIDVINEIAFLVMDLHAWQRPAMAWRFANTWLERSGDYAGVAVLRFYLVYRALVRAKVEALAADFAACRRYLALAAALKSGRRPFLLLTRGPSAAGKSHHSRWLAERLGAIRIRSDVERKRMLGLPAEADAAAPPGEGIYAPAVSRRVYRRLAELAGAVLQAGYPAIVDAVCATQAQRRQLGEVATRHGLPVLLVEFTASPATLRRRIRERPREVSDAGLAVLEAQLARWEPLDADEQARAITVPTDEAPDREALLAAIRARLE
ncbi:MAG: hypothetical protein D6727_09675, partial [Gammaproteobacteria bacterium]